MPVDPAMWTSSPAAVSRITRLAAALRTLRRSTTTIPGLVREVIRELDIDTEVDALPAAELPVGASREVQVQGRTLMMHRVDETTVTAFTNVCTHQGCLLQVVDRQEGPAYACPCHGSHFDVTSGKPFGGPARKALMDYDAAVVDDRIVVKL